MNLRKLLALVLAMALIFSSVTIAGAESFYSDAGYSSAGAASEVSDSPSSDDVGGDNGSAEQTPGEGDETGLSDDNEENGYKEDYEQDTGSDEDTDADVVYEDEDEEDEYEYEYGAGSGPGGQVALPTVEFNMSGGTFPVDSVDTDALLESGIDIVYINEDTFVATVPLGMNFSYLAIPNPVREEYQFAGWVDANGDRIAGNAEIIGDLTIYARWITGEQEAGYSVAIGFDEDNDDELDYFFVETGADFDLLNGVSAFDELGGEVEVFVIDDGGFAEALRRLSEDAGDGPGLLFPENDDESEPGYGECETELDNGSEFYSAYELEGEPNGEYAGYGSEFSAAGPSSFTVTYGAVHPVSGEEFSRERAVMLVQGIAPAGIMPLLAVTVTNETDLRNAIAGATGSSIEIDVIGNIPLTQAAGTATTSGTRWAMIAIPAGTEVTLGGSGTLTTTGQGRHFTVTGQLILQDNITLTNDGLGAFGGGVDVRGGGELIMNGGEIAGNTGEVHVTGNGGGVHINVGNFIMNDGTITGNQSLGGGANGQGGGVFVTGSGSSFVMNGGLITLNQAGNLGSGVHVRDGATFAMESGAEIIGNFGSSWGGGVWLGGDMTNTMDVTHTMTGGLIENNFATNGAGVVVNAVGAVGDTVFTMSGGSIESNSATAPANGNGGGVHVMSGGIFNMTSGIIENNIAGNQGGGVSLISPTPFTPSEISTFNMSGDALIRGNGASDAGGGVFLQQGSAFNMESGLIVGNTANVGAGVSSRMANTIFTMNGGIIGGAGSDSNIATTSGGGVEVNVGGSFIMNSGEIIGNIATNNYGGGVRVLAAGASGGGAFVGSSFTMNDGEISGNDASISGGGVSVLGNNVNAPTTFTMNGGNIEDNDAGNNGGGVSVYGNNWLFNMSGGVIEDNEAVNNGGGVSVTGPATSGAVINSAFTMSNGAVIEGNIAGNNGGGIWVNITATLNAANSSITNNTAGNNGGGIFAMNYGTITTAATTVFSGNSASAFYDWYLCNDPSCPITNIPVAHAAGGIGGNASAIQWQGANSVVAAHILNNYDVNYNGRSVSLLEVVFNGNDGTVLAGNARRDVLEGRSLFQMQNMPTAQPTRLGSQFRGWNLVLDGTGSVFSSSTIVTEAITNASGELYVYAQWSATVTFDLNGGMIGGQTTTPARTAWTGRTLNDTSPPALPAGTTGGMPPTPCAVISSHSLAGVSCPARFNR